MSDPLTKGQILLIQNIHNSYTRFRIKNDYDNLDDDPMESNIKFTLEVGAGKSKILKQKITNAI